MAIDDKIIDDKLQYNINRKPTKISALLSGNNNKYEYLTGGEKLLFNQRRVIEQPNFA